MLSIEENNEDRIHEIYYSASATSAANSVSLDSEKSIDEPSKPIPFNLQWVYGINENTPIINMNTSNDHRVFFAAAHNAILYNCITKKMDFMENHQSIITHLARDGSGKVIITADSGNDNCVNIWNAETLEIMKTILNPHGSFEMTLFSQCGDRNFLLTFGYEEEPTLKLWDWLDERSEPIIAQITLNIPNKDAFTIIFNPGCSLEFCVVLKKNVIFGYIKKDGNDKYKLKKKICNVQTTFSDVGNFQCATYNNKAKQLVACTSRGYLAIFKRKNLSQSDKVLQKEFLKIVKIERNGITVVKDCDGYLVVCNEDGQIHVYSSDIKILHRFDDFGLGLIKSLSFNLTLENVEEGKNKFAIRPTLSKKDGEKQDFIKRDAYISVQSEGIGLIDFVNSKYYSLLNGFMKIMKLAIHPQRTLICAGDSNNKMYLIDYVQHSIISTGFLPYKRSPETENIIITCLQFSPSGTFLFCGVSNGEIWLYDSMLLQLISIDSLKNSKLEIEQIAFSHDSLYMAASNIGFCTFLFKYDCHLKNWKFVGKVKDHSEKIINMFFESSDNLKLLTFGEDKLLNIYSIQHFANEETSFMKLKTTLLEKYAVTKSTINNIWPSHRELQIIASDDYKFKVFDYETERLLATYLGPRYSSPILKMMALTLHSCDPEYIIFCTKKHIGIQKLPLDGNPFKCVAILGHPIKISNFVMTPDGRTLFTSGEDAHSFSQWNINITAVEIVAESGGSGSHPFIMLIEGKKTGFIFEQMRVLFYFAQILCQNDLTPHIRKISDVIPVAILPEIFKAIGYFPTDFEIFNKTKNTDVSFEYFVKLYVNYRPAFGIPYCKYQEAFSKIADAQKDETEKFKKSALVSFLTTYGENVSEDTLRNTLQILASQHLQKAKNDKSAQEDFDLFFSKMTADFFFGDLLGFNLAELNGEATPYARNEK